MFYAFMCVMTEQYTTSGSSKRLSAAEYQRYLRDMHKAFAQIKKRQQKAQVVEKKEISGAEDLLNQRLSSL